eukprot:TRINITY_DN25229_c0_g1_i1.p1 TRINITY_DN25229_c0_g1~~TRINITY_DN25229_c0_g1_i1.p1  ORF type:complete len:196 (-),score=25.18 TRINITY_DN25229_c0_g1_i1:63-650(-)
MPRDSRSPPPRRRSPPRRNSRPRSPPPRRSLSPRRRSYTPPRHGYSPPPRRRSPSRRRSPPRREPSPRRRDSPPRRRESPPPRRSRSRSRPAPADTKPPPAGGDIEVAKAVVVDGKPRASTGEATWRAEIFMPQSKGVANYGGKMRTMCIRGPHRTVRDQAYSDADKLQKAAETGETKAVKDVANEMARGGSHVC